MNSNNTLILLLLTVVVAVAISAAAYDIDDSRRLTMRHSLDDSDTSTFKLVQITDIHYGEGENTLWGPMQDVNSTRVMKTILELEKPDFVLFSGDLITGNNIVNNATDYWKEALGVVLEMGIPWAITFGNHDDLATGYNDTRVDLLNYDISLGSYSMFGPEDVPGITNYYLPIYDKWSNDIEVVIWVLDSGDGACPPPVYPPGPAPWCNTYITEQQVAWYEETAKALYINDSTELPFAAAFFHIPIQEYMNVWNEEVCYGWNNDSIACQPQNGGLFDAFKSIGDVQFMSVGHNHGNDFCGTYEGIDMCFGRHSGYGGYGTWERGARILEINRIKGQPVTHKTWLTMETGQRIYTQPTHQPDPANPQTQCT
ncbi:hypothetical protein SAMD00019534_039610 [Acytostelium subglobosum LB1]|uniref:hypothetical protein n=1 Tax=Acytostelium subglobosum LB1 TaxID=1410327 RepID=UPI0006448F38|nr:hypothetical protein SAMD00019534_039610 [Acytostelium subglobosum LB1]GAM20786.1 hypothetical protein SAMD00019534_039610 [Acytostelium subglobosum LB1]|eukprot:XP_012755920.1 hypothetical protein SAMD00019534_039610 [Acytostelium subglobosum LB1]